MSVNNKFHQRGWTIIGGLMALIIIAFVVLIGMKIVPIYIDHFNIQSSIKSISEEPGVERWTPRDVRNALDRHFNISYIDVIQAKDVRVKKKDGKLVVELVYEDRRPLISNLDIVANFNKNFTLGQ